MFIDYLVLMSAFCSSNFQFSFSQIDKITYVTSWYRLTPMPTVYKHLLFDAPWIGTYDRICLKEFGMEQVITLACSQKFVWWLFWFLWYEEDNYFTREAEIINDIVHVYDLDKDLFRILSLEREIYSIVLFKCEKIISYVPLGCIFRIIHIKKYWKQIFITSVTKVQGFNNHQYLRFRHQRHQRLEILARKTCEIYSFFPETSFLTSSQCPCSFIMSAANVFIYFYLNNAYQIRLLKIECSIGLFL